MIPLRYTHLRYLHSRDKRSHQEELEGPHQDLSRMDLYLEANCQAMMLVTLLQTLGRYRIVLRMDVFLSSSLFAVCLGPAIEK